MGFERFGSVALAAFLGSAALPCDFAQAGDILNGPPTVIDGDTLRVRGTVVGLAGVAAPKIDQVCEAKSGPVPCGRQAASALADRIGGSAITCETRGSDRAHRVLAICRLGNEDLNAWMVSSGLAVSERFSDKTYFANETTAWAKRRGLWAGVFEDPADRPREDYATAAVSTAPVTDAGERKAALGIGLFKLSRLAK